MDTTDKRRYEFDWALLGDLDLGRPTMGSMMRVEAYRLMQSSFRDVLEQKLGTEGTDAFFYEAGELAGRALYKNMFTEVTTLAQFVERLTDVLQNLRIGILMIEKADPDAGVFVMTVSEDLDCSGLPVLDFPICSYDEGLIAALMESFTGDKFVVREVDCWCTGARTCRFSAERVVA
ncbi:MAG: V4R domain-containing protein [Coriobacteriia bacterium]|nr:V4R domain-containing protein [Coriobacteriia bacterium]